MNTVTITIVLTVSTVVRALVLLAVLILLRRLWTSTGGKSLTRPTWPTRSFDRPAIQSHAARTRQEHQEHQGAAHRTTRFNWQQDSATLQAIHAVWEAMRQHQDE